MDDKNKRSGDVSGYQYDYIVDGEGWTFIIWRGNKRDRNAIVTEQWVTGTEKEVLQDINREINRQLSIERTKR